MSKVPPYSGVIFAGSLLLTALAYGPGLAGPFIFDDTVNIVRNTAVHMTQLDLASLKGAAFSYGESIFKRSLAMTSFAVNHLFGGLEPYGYKVTNLVIHLINCVLVYWLATHVRDAFASRGISQPALHAWTPLLAASIWALHPIQLTSVLYVVQRMTSLAALFVLAGLVLFMTGRRRLESQSGQGFALMTAGVVGGTLLGGLCKENAVLLPLFALLLEVASFRFCVDAPLKRRLVVFYGIFVGAPLLAAATWLLVDPAHITNGYRWREFTLGERLLTQPRILWFYVSLFLFPDIRRYSLYYDDIEVSTSLLVPPTTALATAGLGTAVVIAVLAHRRHPWLLLGTLWFLAGHLLESSIIALELVHLHRNYVPSVGLALASAYGIAWLLGHLTQRWAAVVLSLAIVGTLCAVTASYAAIWRDGESLGQFMLRHHPLSARAHIMLASLRAESGAEPLATLLLSRRAAELAPSEPAYLIRTAELAARSVLETRLENAQSLADLLPSELSQDFVVVNQSGKYRLWPKPALVETIRQQLRETPVRSMTSQALISIAVCASDGACAGFYDEIVEWMRIALANPNILGSARHNLSLALGGLYVDFGQLHLAIRLAESARQFHPGSVQIAIMHANVLYLLGQHQQADAVLSGFADQHAELVAKARADMARLADTLSGKP